jgi:hypothetical protein
VTHTPEDIKLGKQNMIQNPNLDYKELMSEYEKRIMNLQSKKEDGRTNS